MTTTKAKAGQKAKVEDMMAMSIEMPTAVREFAEKGLEQAKEGYDKFKLATEEATDAMEDTISAASKGVTDFNLRTVDIAKENFNAGFDFMKALLGAKTVSDAIELNTGFVRERYESAVAQSKELSEIATEVAKVSTKPMTDNAQKIMKEFKLQA